MIRPAKMADVPRLVEMLVALQPETRFADVPVDQDYARKLIAGWVQRDGHTVNGGTLVRVWDEDGVIRGFVVGALDRVYHIGRKLWSSDVYLIVEPDSDPRAMPALLSAYCQWSDANPLVAETRLSWSDATPDGHRMGPVFERMGFVECGRAYRREVAR